MRAEPTLPQIPLLERAALFVTHGGFNSVKEALAAAVPMVVLPIAGDQPYAARRCAALGLGVAVGPADRVPDRIRDAVRQVLHDPTYRDRAERMRTELAALPTVADAVRGLEALVAGASAGGLMPRPTIPTRAA